MSAPKSSYYEILGINPSATSEEIRRAYRILARRYHPDLNPGKSSEERFKIIALAYQTLSDPEKKRAYDGEFESARRIKAGFAAYEKAQQYEAARHKATTADPGSKSSDNRNQAKTVKSKSFNYSARTAPPPKNVNPFTETINQSLAAASKIFSPIARFKDLFSGDKNKSEQAPQEVSASKISIIEVSVSIQDALFGGRKTVEIPSKPINKKISLRIPSGIRTGTVLRMRSGTLNKEDFVIIIRVALDPLIEIQPKGVLIDIPISLEEALFGATLKVPGLDKQESIVVPPGSQSGHEIRISGNGVKFDDGHRGDIFYRLNIQIPASPQAVGLKEKVAAISEYYESPVRQGIPDTLKR